MSERYHRQGLIQGWDQSKLSNAKVAIIGNGILSHYTALNLAALGFGDIEIYGTGKVDDRILANFRSNRKVPDYAQGFLYLESSGGEFKADAMADFLKKINPEVQIRGIAIDMGRPGNLSVLGKPDILFDATNDLSSKIEVMDFALRNSISAFSMYADSHSGGMGMVGSNRKLLENLLFHESAGRAQGAGPSQIISALAVDEARKLLMPLKNEKVLDDIIIYNMESEKRFDRSQDRALEGADDLSKKTVMMVGAGALGNFLGLDLILANIGHLYIVDFDTVEDTNLNRQVWYYDAVGKNKAEALAAKMSKMNPRAEITYLKKKILPNSEKFFRKSGIDLLVDTVDNNKTRALLNYFSLKYDIPFISGGTSYNSGQAIVSVPGKTACLNCQTDIDRSALNAYTPHQSCIYAPQASVITSNQVIAGLMGGEARRVLNPTKYGEPVQYVLKYVSGEKFRLGVLPSPGRCNCKETKISDWMDRMNHLYAGG